MDAVEALTRLGGVADAAAVLALSTRRRLRGAVRTGRVCRVARGRYALPTASDARLAAARLSGVVCLRSAAAAHGWELKSQPELPEVAVPRNRKVPAGRRAGVDVKWRDLTSDDQLVGVTDPLRTVVDCARHLPFDEALTVADSALRSGLVSPAELAAVVVCGRGAARVRKVLAQADVRAANPFESVLRAMCLDAGLAVEPQVPVELGTGVVHPDLVCAALTTVLEADSWTHHATRSAHKRDCARYNLLVLTGWRVLRFTWEQVMLEPGYVRWVLARLAGPAERAEPAVDVRRPA